MFKDFSGVFQRFGYPTLRSVARNAENTVRTRNFGVFNPLSHRILDFYGCPIADLAVTYTEVSRINSAFPFISSVSNISSGVIAQYAGDVQAEINAKISALYTVPITVECPILTAIATRETIYRIAIQRALIQFPPAHQGSHPLQIQHKEDQELLEKIANGEVSLVGASGTVVTADKGTSGVYSNTKNYLPTFHEGSWTDMNVDTDKLDDIASDRDI